MAWEWPKGTHEASKEKLAAILWALHLDGDIESTNGRAPRILRERCAARGVPLEYSYSTGLSMALADLESERYRCIERFIVERACYSIELTTDVLPPCPFPSSLEVVPAPVPVPEPVPEPEPLPAAAEVVDDQAARLSEALVECQRLRRRLAEAEETARAHKASSDMYRRQTMQLQANIDALLRSSGEPDDREFRSLRRLMSEPPGVTR